MGVGQGVRGPLGPASVVLPLSNQFDETSAPPPASSDADANDVHPLRPGRPSFADVITRLEASSELSSVAKRDLKSAIRRLIGTWMARDLGTTPADPIWLGRQMKELTGARFGVSDATFSTVRSQVGRALRVARLRPPRVRRGA